MIRQPTPEADTLEWWRTALFDPRTPRHDGEPQCGFYTRRHFKGGPLVPVRVYLHQVTDPETGELTEPEEIRAEENGWPVDPVTAWTHLRPVPRDIFDALLEEHRTNPRMAATHAKLDLAATPMRP